VKSKGTSWDKNIDGVRIIHVTGSFYEMGYQQGTLLKNEIIEIIRALLSYAEKNKLTYNNLLETWNITEKYIPQEYIDEIKGISDGANISFEKIAAANMLFVIKAKSFECSSFVAWDKATQKNNMIFAKSFDYPFSIKDPETKKTIQENQILMIRKPDKGYLSIYPTFPGIFGSGGFNEKTIGIAILLSFSKDTSFEGIPYRIRIQMALDQASTAQEAISIISKNKTLGYNFVVTDGVNSKAYVVEQTKNKEYIGKWDDPEEANNPFWKVDHVVRRTNCFINSSLSKTQRPFYNPKNPLLILLKDIISFPTWKHYKGLSKGIENIWGNIDLKNSMNMIRDLYRGKNNLFLFLFTQLRPFKKFSEKLGFMTGLYQFVSCPETGDILISFADSDKKGYENSVHQFNLYELS
jgi:predicted choloylglycine hydrolase